jgi:alpha-amylase
VSTAIRWSPSYPIAILAAMPIVARGPASGLARLARAIAALSLVVGACRPAVPSASAPPSAGLPSTGASSPSGSVAAGGPAPTCPPPVPRPQRPWWVTTTFYEVFVRSFADSGGDGIGDLDGLTAHLGYLRDLGVGALWLMPVAASPSYHGYDVTDYTRVEPDYGNAAAFKRLVAAAHADDIRVVVDFEANHTSDEHPWFQDALRKGPHHDWYVWSASDPSWPNPIGGGDPWHASPIGFYYGLFSPAMPDLNLRNADATTAIEQAAGFWLDDMGADGVRIDAARHLIEDGPTAQVNTPETHAWLQAFRDVLHADRGDALVLGEVYDAEITSGSYVTDGSLDMSFDFEIGPAIVNALDHADAGSLGVSEMSITTAYPTGGAGVFLSNHDQTRVMTQLHGDKTEAAQAAATLLTLPGTPFIYYGEELGLTGDKPDERIRTPLPWSADGPGHGFTSGTPWEAFGDGAATANVASESAAPGSLLSAYRALIALRRAHADLFAGGSITPVEASDPHVLATIRSNGAERLLVLQNLSPDAAAAGVSLTLRAGPLCGTGATPLYASTGPGPAVAAPAITSAGGLAGYVPLASLPPRSTFVIGLGG